MRAKTTLAAVSAMLFGLAVLVWLEAARTSDQAARDLATLTATRHTAESDIRRATERLAAAKARERELSHTLDELRRAKSSASAAVAAKPPGPAPRTMTDIIASNPAAEVLMLRWQREVSALEYGPFFRARGITPEQIRRFQDNWVKRAEQDIDLRATSRLATVPDPNTTAALQQQSKASYEAAQAELLGPEAYAQLQVYQRTLPVRNVLVLGLAGAAALEGIPLTAQQGEQLFQAALATTGSADDASLNHEQLLARVVWDALDREAQRILTPAQFALFTSQATPSGFSSRWKYQLDAAVRRAREAEANNPSR